MVRRAAPAAALTGAAGLVEYRTGCTGWPGALGEANTGVSAYPEVGLLAAASVLPAPAVARTAPRGRRIGLVLAAATSGSPDPFD